MLRIIQIAFLASVGFYALIGESVGARDAEGVRNAQWILIFFSAWAVTVMLLFRGRLLRAAEETLRLQPDDPAALTRWRTGHFLTFCCAETPGICGLLLRLLGGTLLQAVPFYAVAVGLMLVFTPRRPE